MNTKKFISLNEEKEHDYYYIIKVIESCLYDDHLKVANAMIDLFDKKWKTDKNSNCDLLETIELRGILKYKRKMLEKQGMIIS